MMRKVKCWPSLQYHKKPLTEELEKKIKKKMKHTLVGKIGIFISNIIIVLNYEGDYSRKCGGGGLLVKVA